MSTTGGDALLGTFMSYAANLGDLDGDGDLDIVISNQGGMTSRVQAATKR